MGSSVRYGRQQEEQADEVGLEVLAAAGYAPIEAVRALQHLVEIEALYGGQFEDPSSHPEAERRVSVMARRASRLGGGGRIEAETYLHAYCHVREDERVFRLSRIARAEPIGGRPIQRRRRPKARKRGSGRHQGSLFGGDD